MEFVQNPQSRVEAINHSLSPEQILIGFNESLNKKYAGNAENRKTFSVFEADQLKHLHSDTGFKYLDADFVNHIANTEVLQNRNQLLEAVTRYLSDSQRYDEVRSRKPIKAGSPQAKLRRTAAILYKSLIVPEQNVQSGEFKSVESPIGVDNSLRDPIVDKILENNEPVWRWDGNFRMDVNLNQLLSNKRDSRQLVRATERYVNVERRDIFENEHDLIRYLNQILGDPISGVTPYLPNVRSALSNSQYSEFLPNVYKHETVKKSLKAGQMLVFAVEEIWNKAGVINLDLRPSSIRERSNGDVVIVDWGEYTELNPGELKLPSDMIMGGTSEYFPPEAVQAAWGTADDKDLMVEPYLVYKIGATMFADLFPEKQVNNAVRDLRGYRWNMPKRVDGGAKDTVSMTNDTYEAVKKTCPEVQIPVEVDMLLTAMLDPDPEKRPSLSEVKRVLQKAS